MSQSANKYLGKSKYKGVSIEKNAVGIIGYYYSKTIKGVKYFGRYKSEKECAKQYDLVLIKNGLEPVNILKRKQNE